DQLPTLRYCPPGYGRWRGWPCRIFALSSVTLHEVDRQNGRHGIVAGRIEVAHTRVPAQQLVGYIDHDMRRFFSSLGAAEPMAKLRECCQALFCPLSFGDILFDRQVMSDDLVLIPQRGDRRFFDVEGAVFAPIDDFSLPNLTGANHLPQRL